MIVSFQSPWDVGVSSYTMPFPSKSWVCVVPKRFPLLSKTTVPKGLPPSMLPPFTSNNHSGLGFCAEASTVKTSESIRVMTPNACWYDQEVVVFLRNRAAIMWFVLVLSSQSLNCDLERKVFSKLHVSLELQFVA